MFNHSPRMGLIFKSQTSELVGPTTYIICDSKPQEDRVPFLSTEKRKPSFCKNAVTEAYYTLPAEKITGGISPRFTSGRSEWEGCPTPGPADYDINPDASISSKRSHGQGKLYLCKVPLSGKGTGPSVPTKINENGYWLDAEGNLYRVPPDSHDTTLGPAFYNIQEDTSYCYKGCKWSKRTSKRTTYEILDNPGPGDYDVERAISWQESENQNFREIAKKMSYLPRYCDDLMCRLQRQNQPGPADYSITDVSKCERCSSIYPRPFIKGAKRFEETVNENPGPAQYDFKEVKYPVSKLSAPFSKCASRFPCRTSAKSPGPAEYNVKSAACGKEIPYTLAPFGSCTNRPNVVAKDTYFYPSPAEYDVKIHNRCKIPISSVFKSKVKRFPSHCKKEMTEADLKFNPMRAFKDLATHKSHNTSNVSFNTKAPLIGMFDVLNYENPSPADYDYDRKSELERCKGHVIPVSCRFTNADEGFPGPAHYIIHPSYTRAIYKAFDSHNLSEKESILKKKLKKHPRETWRKWAATLRKHKQLRCFIRGGPRFTHC